MTFKKQKFSLNALLSICLTFCQFEPGVAFKSGAYKKSLQFPNVSDCFSILTGTLIF